MTIHASHRWIASENASWTLDGAAIAKIRSFVRRKTAWQHKSKVNDDVFNAGMVVPSSFRPKQQFYFGWCIGLPPRSGGSWQRDQAEDLLSGYPIRRWHRNGIDFWRRRLVYLSPFFDKAIAAKRLQTWKYPNQLEKEGMRTLRSDKTGHFSCVSNQFTCLTDRRKRGLFNSRTNQSRSLS